MCGSGSGSTNTVTSSSSPPQAFLNEYTNTTNQANAVASTPYQQYTGNLVAGLSPDQSAAISEVENAQGIQNPYINSAAQYINNSTTPLWSNVQQFSPSAVNQYESPYTQQVVGATQAEFNNQNQQQANQLNGNAISNGAFGGDRTATAQAQLAGQQQLSQAPTIASLENQGYSQALGEFNTQQQSQLGANEANSWLNSQAGYGMANLGSEALSGALTGANSLMSAGSTEQQQAQSLLNVPYEQYTAAQAYPFQTTSWLSGIASGLGSNSGGTSSTSYPSTSTSSQLLGTGLATTGILGETGAFGSNGYLSNLFSSGSSDLSTGGFGAANNAWDLSGAARGGMIPRRASGGITSSNPTLSQAPNTTIVLPSGISGVQDPSQSYIQSANQNSGTPLILQNYGSNSTTTGGSSGGSGIGSDLLGIAGIASHFLRHGGMVPMAHRASGGINPTTVALQNGSYAGSPSVPQLSGGTYQNAGGSGITANSPSSDAGPSGAGAISTNPIVQNYLVGQQNTANLPGSASAHPTIYNPSTGSYVPSGSVPAGVSAPSSSSSSASTTSSADLSSQEAANALSALFSEGSSTTSGGARGGAMPYRDSGGDLDDDMPPSEIFGESVPTLGGGTQSDTNEDVPSLGGMAPSQMSRGMVPLPTRTTLPETDVTASRSGTQAPANNNGPPPPPSIPANTNTSSAPPSHSGEQGPPSREGNKTDVWKLLTDVGAGIMSGTSNNALTNVGRGLSSGLKQYTSEQQAATNMANKAEQIARQLKNDDERNAREQANAAETARHHQVTEQQTQLNEGNRLDLGYAEINAANQRNESTIAAGNTRSQAQIDAANQRNQASLALRQNLAAQASNDRERAAITHANEADLNAALRYRQQNTVRDPIQGTIKSQPTMEESLGAIYQSRVPQQAIHDLRQDPKGLGDQFRQKYKVDPSVYLQQNNAPQNMPMAVPGA